MLNVFKKSLAAAVVMVAATIGMAGTAAAIDLTGANCGTVLSVANGTYVLTEDMICSTKHGLIIGASGITIDGNGFSIYGTTDGLHPDSGTRDCLVEIYDATNGYECVEHGCRSEIDSGVYNAIATDSQSNLIGGCGATDGSILAGQGGCSGVTVKNLTIRGFCDGIFMSGTCYVNDDHTLQAPINGILIEGNVIANNGVSCGTSFTGVEDTVGYWGTTAGENAYFNDGIFVAMAGQELYDEAADYSDCTERSSPSPS